MPRQPPDHRARALKALHANGQPYPGEDPFDIAYLQALRGEECATPAVADAAEWHADVEFRHVLDALFLSHASDVQISDGLSASLSILSAYRHLFFDTDVFWHDMDRRRYANNLDVDNTQRSLYGVAVDMGPIALLAMLKVGAKPKTDPVELVEIIANDQAANFLRHRGNNLLSELSKEARKWGNDAVSSLCSLIDKRREASQAVSKSPVDIRLLIERTQSSMADLGIDKNDIAG